MHHQTLNNMQSLENEAALAFAKNADDSGLLKRPNELCRVSFDEQPPLTIRKSNFFNFTLSLYDQYDQRIQVESARFVEFIKQDDQISCHGTRYKCSIIFANGQVCIQTLDVTLVDSLTKDVINFEGTETNLDLRRVLLTHDVTCSRCKCGKHCGNKNEMPADPVILSRNLTHRYKMKVFLKCNQNCIRNAGNPKMSRRFQLRISRAHHILGYSECIFVHNNSKHGRGKPRKLELIGEGIPIPTIDNSLTRLASLIPRYRDDPETGLPKEVILMRAADALETGPYNGSYIFGSQPTPQPVCTYFNNQQSPSYLPPTPSSPCEANMSETERIIVNGTTGPLPGMASFNSLGLTHPMAMSPVNTNVGITSSPNLVPGSAAVPQSPAAITPQTSNYSFTFPPGNGMTAKQRSSVRCLPTNLSKGYPSMVPVSPGTTQQYMHQTSSQVFLVDNNQNEIVMTSAPPPAYQKKRKCSEDPNNNNVDTMTSKMHLNAEVH